MLRRVLFRLSVARQTRSQTRSQSTMNGNVALMHYAVDNSHEVRTTLLGGGGTRCISNVKLAPVIPNEDEKEYEKCITELNTLQSNASTIRRSILLENKQMRLSDMYKHLTNSGLSLERLEQLSIIHVSGTKGKGSTCALTESILRAYGVKTGFFSSPHLMSVTERIRINGEPISYQKFVQAFGRVFQRLKKHREHENDMPVYFNFLTILAFHIFIEERVQVVILEVGIGGEYDCTNIIRNTETVGITSLGLEHTNLLGNTLKEIAWQKAGIIKKNSDVYTSVTQPECLQVIRDRANVQDARVHIVPDFNEYIQDDKAKQLLSGVNNLVHLNGPLAIELAYDWLRKHGLLPYEKVPLTQLSSQALEGLLTYSWPGRCQIIKMQNLNLHLDGAHTVESIQVCSDWFKQKTAQSSAPKVLVFNTTGERDSKKLLEILHAQHQFALAFFVPNIAAGKKNHKDNNSVYGIRDQIKRARMHAGLWHQLCAESNEEDNSSVANSVLESIRTVYQTYGKDAQVDVLFTGSLHLIGATMTALQEFDPKAD